MKDTPNFDNHEPMPEDANAAVVDAFVGDVVHDLAQHTYQLELAQRRAATVLREGADFSAYLAAEFPDRFGGEKTLDPLTAYELLQQSAKE